MLITLKNLVDDARCYETVRSLRWADGRKCAFCQSNQLIRKGFDDTQAYRQRYQCKKCRRRFDDLTGTIFSGHHQSLKVWILCLYLMGLNLSNDQIGRELDLNKDDVHQMTSQLREGVEKKAKRAAERRSRV